MQSIGVASLSRLDIEINNRRVKSSLSFGHFPIDSRHKVEILEFKFYNVLVICRHYVRLWSSKPNRGELDKPPSQRRALGNVDFYRGWAPYKQGFGNATGDHWMGLEAIHQLTKNVSFLLPQSFLIKFI